MRGQIFQVDAFAARLFAGNPAAVVLLDVFPDDAVMQEIAAENNLSETAFLVRAGTDYRLRWFTPRVEVPLCGHATLASAAVVMERLEPGRDAVVFHSASGPLRVDRNGPRYAMDFPARRSSAVPPPPGLAEALGTAPLAVHGNEFNYLVRVGSPSIVRELTPDLEVIARMDRPGVIVTAAGDGEFDFTSRYFAPAKGIPEDPVTGGAHCMLVPYWAEELGRSAFRAYQASRRGGEMWCRLLGERVELQGTCVLSRRTYRPMKYDGSCHCGAVRFRIDAPIVELTTCDCSLCVMRNALMTKVPEGALTVLEGEAELTLYEWNTRRAKHYFCRRCGIYVFHRKRAAPDHYGINVFCLEGFDVASVPVRATEGANMTIEVADAPVRWPGPRR